MKQNLYDHLPDEDFGDDPGSSPKEGLIEENRELRRRLRRLCGGEGAAINHFARCAVIAEPSEWAEELEHLGAHRFRQPETLYKAFRNRSFLPAACIVDLDALPRTLIKAVDLRVPCPKVWVGGSAADPADIKHLGAYHAKSRPDELNVALGRLVGVEQSTLLPAGTVPRQMLPFLAADEANRAQLKRGIDLFAGSNLLTLRGDDPTELQLAARYMAVGTRRARTWEARSASSLRTVQRRIVQARRPGTDVTIIVGRDVDPASARQCYRSMPPEYSMIKLAARAEEPLDRFSLTLAPPADRPADLEAWIVWFVSRTTIQESIALSNLDHLVETVIQAHSGSPTVEEIRDLCERAVRQFATTMEEDGEFQSYNDLVRNYERTILRQSLSRHDWNLSATARSLGLAESSLRYKLQKLGVTRRDASN